MEGPTKVDLDHALPCVFVYAIEALAFRLPGVVDQDIDDAERLFGLRTGLHDLTALGDVAAHEARLPRKTAHRPVQCLGLASHPGDAIGRGACRERGWKYGSITV